MQLRLLCFVLAMTCVVALPQSATAALLGTYEFTDNSLTITDADAGDGITFSDFNLNSYTTDEAFSDSGDAVADPTLDFISLNGVESPNGTSSAFANGDYFSFTVTNNSGSTLYFRKLAGEFDKTTVFQNFQSRVFNTNTPSDVLMDTISKLGAASGGTDLELDDAFLDGSDPEQAGSVWTGVPLTVANGDSITLYLPFNMNSNSASRYMGIDNIEIHSIPEPSTTVMLLLGVVAAGGVVPRRVK